MAKPTGEAVAARAAAAVAEGHTYAEMDCQAFIEHCVAACGGQMAYAGSNDMARNAVTGLWPLAQARAAGRLVPGAGLFIREADGGEPARYRADGLGNFNHVGLYAGANALTDTDKNGKRRACDVVHSSATMGRVAGSTLKNGWTHVGWFKAIDYGAQAGTAGEGSDIAEAVDGRLAMGESATDAQTGLRPTSGEGATLAQATAMGGTSVAGGVDAGGAGTVAADTAPAAGGVDGSGAQAAPDAARYDTVRRGCKGSAVRRLHTWLGDLGYDVGKTGADGDFGPLTDATVRAFQAGQALKADGIVGKATWRALALARAAAAEGAGEA